MASWKNYLPHVSQRQAISTFKGALAYTLVFVLTFTRDFNKLTPYPVVLSGAVVVAIAGQPGNSVGAVLGGTFLGMIGVLTGCLCFLILAKMGSSQVAQGFTFWVMLYIFAIIKAQSMRYFAFSILGILVTFSGIYTSVLLGGVFEPTYLKSYIYSYCWGFAIVVAVNVLVFPISSERQLRELLVASLEHIATFSHLIAKTYVLEISDDERKVRDSLNQTIRQDFGFLSQKLGETGFEINYTRWSIADYARMIKGVRQMQQGLITSYSSLVSMEKLEPASLDLIKKDLLDSSSGRAFAKLRRGTDLVICEIVKELAVGGLVYQSPAPGEYSWEDFRDDVDDGDEETLGRDRAPSIPKEQWAQVRTRLAEVSARLRQEVEQSGSTPTGTRPPSLSGEEKDSNESPSRPSNPGPNRSNLETDLNNTLIPSTRDLSKTHITEKNSSVFSDRTALLKTSWKSFIRDQNTSVVRMLAENGRDDGVLMLDTPGPSARDLHNRPLGQGNMLPSLPSLRRRRTQLVVNADDENEPVADISPASEDKGPEEIGERCGTAVMRVFSFIFGMGQVVEELAELHKYVVPHPDVEPRKKGIHFHFFERVPKDKPAPGHIHFKEALASLNGRTYSEPKIPLVSRIRQLEHVLRSDTSIFAFKTATAVSTFAVFILAPSLKSFFVNYGLTGGLISILVAMAPTLGQTILTFVLQICGTGVGTMFGLIILEIFKGVGGYHFNPFGIACLLAIYAVPFNYIIYTKPQYFAGALLALNGAGTLIITEWVYREIPGQIRPAFDAPALRAGKALTALSIALAIGGIFQVFILRIPARRKLRLQLANITFELGEYNIILSQLVAALVPLSGITSQTPPEQESLRAVQRELIRREGHIQIELLELMPLLKFAQAEPAFGVPFQAGVLARLIRSHQLVLDRLREARTSVGLEGFNDDIKRNFTDILAPYRRQARRFSRALFYLCATSIATKTPLPSELPSMVTVAKCIEHDAQMLSKRLSRDREGRAVLQSDSFLRYWFYLVSYAGVGHHLEAMEADLRILFGEIEDTPFRT